MTPTNEERGAGEFAAERAVTYCVVPRELADPLHDVLRRHFREDPTVEVIVERREAERRRRGEQRTREGKPPPGGERRRVLATAGRRVGERRAPLAAVKPPQLPRRARRHADKILFVRRSEPSTQVLEDRDTARVVARHQAGDPDAFSVLYKRYFDRVYAYMRMVLNDSHEAEDATHEVFISLLEWLDRYERRRQPFRAWLFTVVRNRAVDVLRKQGRLQLEDNATLDRRREAAEEGALDIVDWIADRDLSLFVERLPLPQRQVLVLRYVIDLPHSEIARVLGRSEVDVRTLQHRALEYLRERLSAVRAKAETPPNAERRSRSRAYQRQAPVLRMRRFSLDP